MSNIIDKIQVSGVQYTLSAQTGGGSGNPTVELTQAEYDALVSAGTVANDTYYIITDAPAVDISNYYTSAQTNAAINAAVSGKVDTSTFNTALSGKQDTLVSGENIKTINNQSLLGSGNITIQGGGGGDSTVSAFTDFKVAIPSECDYGTVTTFYIKCTAPLYQSGAGTIIMFYLYNGSPFSTVDKSISANYQGGVYISVTSSDASYTATIEDGIIKVVLTEGYSLKNIYYYNQCVAYTIHEYSSGYTSDVMVDTVYDALGKLSDDTITPKLVDASLSLGDGRLTLSKTKTNGDNTGAAMYIESSTINTDGGRLNVHFSGTTQGEKVLNTGNGNYCDIINTSYWEYEKAYDNVTITINSGYTGSYTSFDFWVGFITNGSTVQYTLTYYKTNNSVSVPSEFSTYATIQDTLSTDYKFKIIPNSGYRVRYLNQTSCLIGGIDNDHPNDYITNLITTSSYDLNGQDIIDDIYSKISGGGGEVSSAITSGDTNAVAGGAVYDKFNEVEQVTARALVGLAEADEVAARALVDLHDELSGKVETSAMTEAITAAVSGKQDTLIAGENITISGNVISASGGGSTYTAGRGINITNDTISVSLPISAGTGQDSVIIGSPSNRESLLYKAGTTSFSLGADGALAIGQSSFAGGSYSKANAFASIAFGRYINANNYGETSVGFFNSSNGSSSAAGNSSGNTLFSVGNGTAANARHNAFEIRQNGDMYLNNGTSDIKLQDYLQIKVVKLTQSAYDALSPNYDSNTLYIIKD